MTKYTPWSACMLACLLVLAGCAARPPAPSGPAPEAPVERPVAVQPEIRLDGVLQQGAMVTGRVPAGSRLRLGARELRVAPDGTFVLGLDRDAPPELTLQLELADGRTWQETWPVRARQYDIQRVTGIAKRIMEPKPEDVARSREEAAQVAAARARDDARLDFLQSFIWPATGRVTGVYGSQRYYNGEPGRPHYGVDVGIPTGTPVVAPAAGIVTLAHPDMFYSGGTLIIDHGHGISSTLMHLSEILVQEGQSVAQGELVARSGSTGRSSGPHLDWRMNWFGERIDPQLLVPPMSEARGAGQGSAAP